MARLNFSWLVEGQVAGHAKPMSEDDLIHLKSMGIGAAVRLAEADRAGVTSAVIRKVGLIDCHEPVADSAAPKQEQIDRIVTFITRCVGQGIPVGVSCGAGIGRTGTVLACYLVSKGKTAQEAMDEVQRKRGGGIETEEQKAAVRSYAGRIAKPN